MKGFAKIALAATLVAGVSARHTHNHAHLHRRQHDAVVGKRGVVTMTAYGPTQTVYELDGSIIPEDQARAGIENGAFAIVGGSDPSPATPSATVEGGQFLEQNVPTSTLVATSITPAASTTTTAAAVASTTTSSKTSSSTTTSSTAKGLDAEFPDGELDCSVFPSDYGAIPIDWMGLGGWSGIQQVPSYSVGDVSISLIVTGVKGESCGKNSFCSYACPAGYQKTQWPSAQGSTLQSIGGLYCNSNGKLELSRPSVKTLCEKGVGGVTIQNDLSSQVSTCRTDYPGTENMVVPLLSEPGSSHPLCNPDQTTYYVWDNKFTTAQYYINKAGYGLEDACVWTSSLDPTGAGNWAPMNLGVGQNAKGETYIGLFLNQPTSTAILDFNVAISINGAKPECYYENGVFSNGGTGCTAAMTKGGNAVVRYYS